MAWRQTMLGDDAAAAPPNIQPFEEANRFPGAKPSAE